MLKKKKSFSVTLLTKLEIQEMKFDGDRTRGREKDVIRWEECHVEVAPYTQIHWGLKVQCNDVFYKRNMVATIGLNDTQNVL